MCKLTIMLIMYMGIFNNHSLRPILQTTAWQYQLTTKYENNFR